MTLLQSFERELYRSRLTLKSLETDTLYLVFKDRLPIVRLPIVLGLHYGQL